MPAAGRPPSPRPAPRIARRRRAARGPCRSAAPARPASAGRSGWSRRRAACRCRRCRRGYRARRAGLASFQQGIVGAVEEVLQRAAHVAEVLVVPRMTACAASTSSGPACKGATTRTSMPVSLRAPRSTAARRREGVLRRAHGHDSSRFVIDRGSTRGHDQETPDRQSRRDRHPHRPGRGRAGHRHGPASIPRTTPLRCTCGGSTRRWR